MLLKDDSSFKRISWDKALDEIAMRIRETKEAHGPQSVGIYTGSGNIGMASSYASRFANVLGTRMIPGASEICYKGGYEGARFNVGPFPPHELGDWANSKCILIWGTNKFESSIHSKRVIQEAIDNGAKLVVIDPRKTPHAKMADIYTTIRPGTDAALALGIANVIIRRNLYNHEFVESHVAGFEQYKRRVAEYDLKRVTEITWVEANAIEAIAVAYSTHGPALIMTGPAGFNHYTNGTWAARAVHSLVAICGYLGVSGGGFQYSSSDYRPFNSQDVTLHNHLDLSITPIVETATYLPEYILSSDESPLRVLVIQAANPITQWPNANKTKQALEEIPYKVCIDQMMTDTARLCDIVLPATTLFEHHNLVHSSVQRIVQYAPKIVEPLGEAKHELEIWTEIAERVSLGEYFKLTEIDAIRLALESDDCAHIEVEDLIKHPEGIRTTSPAIPFSDRRFTTRSGKFELFSQELKELGYDPLPVHEEPAESPLSTPELYEEFPLIMITGRLRTSLHSQFTTSEVGSRAYLKLHPDTAKNLGLTEGDLVSIESRRGRIDDLQLQLTEDIDPRVVWASDGWWVKDGNMNLLTDDLHTAFGHTPGFNSVLVSVTKSTT
ncbi:MAG: molybdopterin-containing oxidoreductase family protein [Candidatus Thorarchaeota archaeon]